MSDRTESAGMMLIGMGIGSYLPSMPDPLTLIDPVLGLLFVAIGIILLIFK